MKAYAQTTIHSKNSKMKKANGQFSMGRIIKGSRLGITHSLEKAYNYRQIGQTNFLRPNGSSQVQENEQNSQQQLKIKKSVYQQDFNRTNFQTRLIQPENIRNKFDGQSLFDSAIFPAIYFKKTTMRNVLKQFVFPLNCKALPPNDQRSPLIYQIVANLFIEINFYVFNILVSEDPKTQCFYAFFSDSEVIPFTKCCNTPAHVQMLPNGSGKILCNQKNCPHPSLAEFLINYEDGKKIWKDITYLNTAPQKDTQMKQKIARSINTGKYKNYRLKNLIHQTTKQVSQVFYKTRKNIKDTVNQSQNKQFSDTFVTNVETKKYQSEKKISSGLDEEQTNDLILTEDKNIDLLKVKIMYMTKMQKGLKKRLAKSIIDDSKVFHKKFDMSQKIDELMRKTKHSNNTTYLSFPRLMQQLKTKEQKRNQSISRQVKL